MAQNMYSGWLYQDREGKLSNYEQCVTQFEEYKTKNKNNYKSPHIPPFVVIIPVAPPAAE